MTEHVCLPATTRSHALIRNEPKKIYPHSIKKQTNIHSKKATKNTKALLYNNMSSDKKLLIEVILNHFIWSMYPLSSRYLQVRAEPRTLDPFVLLCSAKLCALTLIYAKVKVVEYASMSGNDRKIRNSSTVMVVEDDVWG